MVLKSAVIVIDRLHAIGDRIPSVMGTARGDKMRGTRLSFPYSIWCEIVD